MTLRLCRRALCAALLAVSGLTAAEARATLVVLNGKVVTVDGRNTVAEAVAVRNGVFVYVGDNRGAQSYIGRSTNVLDAAGKSVVPGLIETHVHSVWVARDAADEPFQQLSSLADITTWVRAKAARSEPGAWIKIPRVDLTRFREGRFPPARNWTSCCRSSRWFLTGAMPVSTRCRC